MTIHANTSRRDPRMAASTRGIMAVKAWDLVIACVYLVGEGDRLLRSIALVDSYPRQLPRTNAACQDEADDSRSEQLYRHLSILFWPKPGTKIT